MRSAYVIRHWILTLLIAPFTSQAIDYFYGTNPHQVVGLLEVYPITLIFSIVFSLPTFAIYLACFHFLSKHPTNLTVSRIILIAVSVLGIFITQTIIEGVMSQEIIVSYSITAIVVGLVLRLKETKAMSETNRIAT